MLDYRSQNAQLLSWCLAELENREMSKPVKTCLQLAFEKSIKTQSSSPVPPLLSLLLADDLGYENAPWARDLAIACAYFYTAADLLDDIQDKDPNQPLLKTISAEQAMNITNFLLMGSYQTLLGIPLAPDRQVALAQLFTQMGSTMSQGQYWDIESTNQRGENRDPEVIARAKAGSEIACFLACVPHALGEKTSVFSRLGEEIGLLLQIFTDYFDIWIVPNQHSLSQDLLVLKNSFPLYWARQDPKLGPEIEKALAGKNDWPQKQFYLRRLLAQSQSIDAFEKLLQQSKANLNACYQELPTLPRLKAFSDFYLDQSQQLISGLRQLQSITANTKWIPTYHLEQSIKMALDYLNFIPDFKDVWEVQRWGFLETPTLYGDIFNPLLILETLSLCGQDIQKPLLDILNRAAEDGWHYYSNTLKIPTDTDDLGQVLHLSSQLSPAITEALFKQPLQTLLNNLDNSGKCPTWLCDGKLHRREEVDKAWFGNECIAVMANLYYGLACHDAERFASQIKQGIDYIQRQYEPDLPGWQGAYYSSQTYTNYLVARLLTKQQIVFPFEAIEQKLLQSQLLDGSWQQSAQETAFAILFLAECWQTRPLSQQQNRSLQSAIAFLIDTQIFDGSWAGEALFIRPGKENVHELFSHPKLTSAFCLRALKKTEQVLLI